MSNSSPTGGVPNRVSFSGNKHQRSNSNDSINDCTEDTEKSSAGIIEDYSYLYHKQVRGTICQFEKKYFDNLAACNKSLDEQRVFANGSWIDGVGARSF